MSNDIIEFKTVKGTRVNMSDMLTNSEYRASVVSKRQENDDADVGLKKALKLLRRILQAAEPNSATAIEICDEIAVLLINNNTGRSLRTSLSYLESANRMEKAINSRSALISARKALIGVILVSLPHYTNGKGNVPLGQALKSKAEKSFKSCDISQIDLARLMRLLACTQLLTDDEGDTGHFGSAADSLLRRPHWSTASITNIVNGVTNPHYKEWMGD
ncbi:MAG: hypothetical protein K2Y22_14515 [Candidatus Obscuribacterales bacterium]|nr:hypothetical protein [Candidatus Obscuribacterales bacterium]